MAAHPWEDMETVIQGTIGAWRACFPRTICANVCQTAWGGFSVTLTRRAPVVDADLVHFMGLWEVWEVDTPMPHAHASETEALRPAV